MIIRSQLSVENPSGLQHVMEGAYNFVGNLGHEIIGHGYEEFMPYLMALGIFILSANLMGLIPGLESPTANTVVPLGCALVTWFYYQSKGILKNGPIGYIKHFIGPQESSIPLFVRLFLPILMFPIEICSHLARLLSLTVRLYANMFAGEMVTLVFFSLIPIRRSSHFRRSSYWCFFHTDVHFRAAGLRVFSRSYSPRTLGFIKRFASVRASARG